MEIDIQYILTTLLTAGGGGGAVAIAIFKRMGNSWLDAKFAEKIEAFRHDRAKELARLRAEIDGALQAKVRYQEKQFDACLDVWNALKESQSKLLVSISPFQQYSDIRKMDGDAREEYLSSFDLQKWQKNEILSAVDMQKSFSDMVDGQRFHEAAQAFSRFDRITRSHELFFEPRVYELIRSISDTMHSCLVSREIALSEREHSLSRAAWEDYDKKCVPLIRQLVQELRELINAESFST